MKWQEYRAQELTDAARRLASISRPKVYLRFSPGNQSIDYFSEASLTQVTKDMGQLAEFVDSPQDADLILLSAHGSDWYQLLSKLRQNSSAVIGLWLWDNHISLRNNLATLLAADFFFPSHFYCVNQCLNPVSSMLGHIPSCCGQWSAGEVRTLSADRQSLNRSDKLFVNYVNYPQYPRSRILGQLANQNAMADVFLMAPEDRSRYFTKSPNERLAEWMSYKTCLILPLTQDFSTRIFDALASGQIPIVPETVADMDRVIPRADQKSLGIVRIEKTELNSIIAGHAQAVRNFNDGREKGVSNRQDYVLDNHMLSNRVEAILRIIRKAGGENTAIKYLSGNNQPNAQGCVTLSAEI